MNGQTNTGEITGPICRNGWAKKIIYFPMNKKFIYHTRDYSMVKNSFLAELTLKDSSILIASDVYGPKLGIQVFSRHTV